MVLSFSYDLVIHYIDVNTTFLNEKLEKKNYMDQPMGYIVPR